VAPLPLESKVAIVTGSSRGIGKVIALRLAGLGAAVVVCARSETAGVLPGTIGETASAITATGGRALPCRVDLAEDADLRRVVDATLEEFGRIDILVNNAVLVGPRQQFLGGTPEFFDLTYRVNVRGPYVLAQLVSSQMAEQGGGCIINITSGAASGSPPARHGDDHARLDPMDPSYGITKAALDRVTTAYAAELGRHNIAVVSVSPGLVATERIRQAALRPDVDLSRAESPEVIAQAVAMLCQSGTRFSGQVLRARDLVGEKSP
jgi:NAD(P)-dependent dehydrogenase (short-subunit alcohol dehydrogenase family)